MKKLTNIVGEEYFKTLLINTFSLCKNEISERKCNIGLDNYYDEFISLIGKKRIDIGKILPTGVLCQEQMNDIEKKIKEKQPIEKEIFLDFSGVEDIDDTVILRFIELLKEYDLNILINYEINQGIYYKFLDRGFFYYLNDEKMYIFRSEKSIRISQVLSDQMLPVIDFYRDDKYKELFKGSYFDMDKTIECLKNKLESTKTYEKIKKESEDKDKTIKGIFHQFQKSNDVLPFDKVRLKYISRVSPDLLLRDLEIQYVDDYQDGCFKDIQNNISDSTIEKLNEVGGKEYYSLEELLKDIAGEISSKKRRTKNDKNISESIDKIRGLSLPEYIQFTEEFFEYLGKKNISLRKLKSLNDGFRKNREELYIQDGINQSILHLLYDTHITKNIDIMYPLVRRYFIKNVLEELGRNIYVHNFENKSEKAVGGFICGRYLEKEDIKKRIKHFSDDRVNDWLENHMKNRDTGISEIIISDDGVGILERMDKKMTENDRNLFKDNKEESEKQKTKLELLFSPNSPLELSMGRDRQNIGIPSFLKVLDNCEGFAVATTCSYIQGKKYAFKIFLDGKCKPSVKEIKNDDLRKTSVGTSYITFIPTVESTHKFVETRYKQNIIDKYKQLKNFDVHSFDTNDFINDLDDSVYDKISDKTLLAIDVENLSSKEIYNFIAGKLMNFCERCNNNSPYICLYNLSDSDAMKMVNKGIRVECKNKPIIIISLTGKKYILSSSYYKKIDFDIHNELKRISDIIDIGEIDRKSFSLRNLSDTNLIFPLELLIYDHNKKILFWRILEKKLKSEKYIISREAIHFALRSGVHKDKFYLVARVFEECHFVELMAICMAEDVVKKIKNTIANEKNGIPKFKIVGYGRYASTFLYSLKEMILELMPDLHEDHIKTENIGDMSTIEERKKKKENIKVDKNDFVFIIHPIGTTFETTEKIMGLIKPDIKDEYKCTIESFCIVHIGPKNLRTVSNWELINSNYGCTIAKNQKSGDEMTVYCHIDSETFSSDTCPSCRNGKILVNCDDQSVHPKILKRKDDIKEYANKNYIEIEKFLDLVMKTKAVIYKHIYSETNHYLFFFRVGKIFDHIKKKLEEYDEFDDFKKEFRKHCLECGADMILVPNHSEVISLARYLNEGIGLKIYTYNLSDKIENFVSYHKKIDEKWGNVVILDDGINSGDTFHVLRDVVNYMGGRLVGFSVIIDRSPSYVKKGIMNQLEAPQNNENNKTSGFYLPFVHLGMPLIRTPDKCPLCGELDELKNINKNAVNLKLRDYISKKIKKLEKTYINENLFYDFEKLLDKNPDKVDRIRKYIMKKHEFYCSDKSEIKKIIQGYNNIKIKDIFNSHDFKEKLLDRCAFLKVYGFHELSEYEPTKGDIYEVLKNDFNDILSLELDDIYDDKTKNCVDRILYLLKYFEILLKVLGKWKAWFIIEPQTIENFENWLGILKEKVKVSKEHVIKNTEYIEKTDLSYYFENDIKQEIVKIEKIVDERLSDDYLFAAKRSLWDKTRANMLEKQINQTDDVEGLLADISFENNYNYKDKHPKFINSEEGAEDKIRSLLVYIKGKLNFDVGVPLTLIINPLNLKIILAPDDNLKAEQIETFSSNDEEKTTFETFQIDKESKKTTIRLYHLKDAEGYSEPDELKPIGSIQIPIVLSFKQKYEISKIYVDLCKIIESWENEGIFKSYTEHLFTQKEYDKYSTILSSKYHDIRTLISSLSGDIGNYSDMELLDKQLEILSNYSKIPVLQKKIDTINIYDDVLKRMVELFKKWSKTETKKIKISIKNDLAESEGIIKSNKILLEIPLFEIILNSIQHKDGSEEENVLVRLSYDDYCEISVYDNNDFKSPQNDLQGAGLFLSEKAISSIGGKINYCPDDSDHRSFKNKVCILIPKEVKNE